MSEPQSIKVTLNGNTFEAKVTDFPHQTYSGQISAFMLAFQKFLNAATKPKELAPQGEIMELIRTAPELTKEDYPMNSESKHTPSSSRI